MRSWLDQAMPQVPPKSTTGQALHYLRNEWDKLNRYLDDGRLEIDNNLAENALRPFVIGRKNWIFSNSVKINKCHYLAIRCDLIAYFVNILALLQDNTPNTALKCFRS